MHIGEDPPAISVAVFDHGSVSLQQLRLPRRGSGEIDLAVTSAAICGSDLHTVLGHRGTPPRTALGHEGMGVVSGIDSGVSDFRGEPLRPGDRVVFGLFSACGRCDRCTAGLTMKCRSVLKYGHESIDRAPHATGTLATGVRLLPGVPVLRVPDDVPDVLVVSAGCAVATAAAVVAAAGDPASALIFGAGAVGVYCTAMLITLGWSVSVIEPARGRLDLAISLGARIADGTPTPVVVEASGNAAAFGQALAATAIGGRLIAAGSVSPGSTTVTIDPALIVTRRLAVHGIHNYTAEDFRWGLDWLLQYGPKLQLDRLVSAHRPLSQVDAAFAQMRSGEHARILIECR